MMRALAVCAVVFCRVAAAAAACADKHNMCQVWATAGECEKNPGYMHSNCQLSCKQCAVDGGVAVGADGSLTAATDASLSAVGKNPLATMEESTEGGTVIRVSHMIQGYGAIDLCWESDGETRALDSAGVRMFSMRYGETVTLNTFSNHVFLWSDVATGDKLSSFRVLPNRPLVVIDAKAIEMYNSDACVDKQPACASRAARGECAASPGWMTMMCSRSCEACYLRDPAVRCARHLLNMRQEPALQPGVLQSLFSGLEQKWPEFNVTVHSSPAGYESVAVEDGPWIATFDGFVSDDEVDSIIRAVNGSFTRSTDQGAVDKYGEQAKIVSQGRTSENAWCTGACEASPAVQRVSERIADVTGVPVENFESFQVLRYLPGQYYRAHHDMSPSDNKLACGPRIYTFFLYLSDVDAGGETEFPTIKDRDGKPLRIAPKKGTALLWPSVLSAEPTKQDGRTRHAALAVEQGIKFAANAWIHMYDYHEPNLWGCTGSFD